MIVDHVPSVTMLEVHMEWLTNAPFLKIKNGVFFITKEETLRQYYGVWVFIRTHIHKVR